MSENKSVIVPSDVVENIAVLKSQHAELRRTVDEGNRVTQQAVAVLSGRIESLADMMQSIAKLQAQHESHRDGLNRAFEEIESTDRELSKHMAETNEWRKGHERENASVEKRLATWQGVAMGVTLSIGLATGAAMWGGNLMLQSMRTEINDAKGEIKTQGEIVRKLDRDAARAHSP
jgi:chromosome segregation ATPase